MPILAEQHFAVAQHADQARLDTRRHLDHVLEEQDAAGRIMQAAASLEPFEAAPLRCGAPRAPIDDAEQFELDLIRRQRGAVDGNEGRGGLQPVGMNGAGDHLAAGAALTHDENAGATAGRTLHQVHHRAHCLRRAHQAV